MKMLLATFFTSALALYGSDIKTASGKEYKDAQVKRVEPDGLVLTTDAGIEKVPFDQLPQALQRKYGYDPKKAEAFEAAVRAAAVRRRDATDGPSAPPGPPELTTAELSKYYAASEIAADENWKGRKISVRGRVARIGRGIAGTPYVLFKGPHSLGIQCLFTRDSTADLAELHPGSQITISGVVRGMLVDVVLDGCRIIKM